MRGLMATADMRADGRDADGALVALTEMQAQGSRADPRAADCVRAQQQLKNWGEVLKLVKTLEKREALHPAVAVRLRQVAAENLLRDRRHNPDALLELWQSLSPAERQSPRLADVAAELLIALDRRNDARKIVEEALAHNWGCAPVAAVSGLRLPWRCIAADPASGSVAEGAHRKTRICCLRWPPVPAPAVYGAKRRHSWNPP